MRRTALSIAYAVLLTPLPAAAQSDVLQIELTTPAGTRAVMTRPAADGPYPAVLHLHGSGDTVANNLSILRLFARAGYVALGVEYRQTGGAEEFADVAAALDVLERSQYVERGAVALNGFSRGARLALRLAAVRDVRAVSAIAARTSAGPSPTIVDDAPRLRVPVLLQHGTEDPLVPHADSVLLAERLKALGRRVEFVSYPGDDHNNLPWDRVYERVLRFFGDHLR